ncbi:hypothetical protein IEQ34_011640 [Dendrobium chrysotoxum]|uniref:Uncharacterized protein n=1 Tax=Dendrobium chrysotoxum TaxID=161865 RepID=A0AAV7GS59_DENCH|nr:hypothetical protein IEQ34_011640 [Dendrobium chrysotoxum]
MMRQSGSRNQRSKGGFRVKLVLQICLLLAICTWLLYQVKHSHDKKKAFEDKISKITTTRSSKQSDLFDFGRKGLPIVKESDLISGTRAKDDENEEEQEEGEQDQDMKQEEAKDDEAKRDGGNVIDELDQDRGDEEENEQEEEFFDEQEKDGQAEEDGLFDNKEVEDSAQEAREENYKRDDASSAVAHDSAMEIEDSKENDLEIAVDGSADDTVNITNETLGYVDPIDNASNASFGENMTDANADPSINGSHSTRISNHNELKHTNLTTISLLEENNVSDNNSPAIQNGSKFNHSVPNSQISHLGRSGMIPFQDQNNKFDASEGHESENRRLSSTVKKNANGATSSSDLLTVPVIQNEVKDSDDKAAE